jgi:HK97 gp10 family phage protein
MTTVKGVAEVGRKLEQVAEDLRGKPFVDGMRRALMAITNDAKREAPVDTGRLRNSIAPEVRVEGKVVMGVVGSNVKYAPHMELGTGTFAGGSRHWPPASALETWARRHGMPNGYVVARTIGIRGGLKPRRFLQRAFEMNRDKVKGDLEVVVNKIVDK